MYKTGHWGASLLAYAPVGFALFAADAPTLAYLGGAGMLWLSTLPDVDHRLPLVDHRGVTHTLAFAALIGGVLGVPVYLLAPSLVVGPGLPAYGFAAFVGAYGIVAHLLADAITPMGVPFLWPLSGRSYTLNVTPAANAVANYLLLAAGVFATVAAVVLSARVGA